MTSDQAKPFLKWVGGKRKLLPQLLPLVPEKYGVYYEPFLGGGAMFFALRPRQALLTDINWELVDCYKVVRDQVDDLVGVLENDGYVYDKEYYYTTRALKPQGLNLVDRAARTIYLNKTGFNGLYRLNGKGEFNVPFGKYKNPTICDEKTLYACSAALQGVFLGCQPYGDCLYCTKAGDFVYMDPPYIPMSSTSNFTAYTADGFNDEAHVNLAREFRRLSDIGVLCMLSNSDTPRVRKLYAGFNITAVKAARSVNCKGRRRGVVGEVVVRNYG